MVKNDFFIDCKLMWKNHKWACIISFCLFFIVVLVLINRLTNFMDKVQNFDDSKLNSLFQNLQNKPISKKLKYETACRRILESYFKRPFNSVRPSWLRNPKTGKCLELDCYNEELNLALEYQGSQHAYFNYHFHKTYENFEYQLWRDKLKKQLCDERGVILIQVPHTVEYSHLKPYIINQLNLFGF